jgi:hypothetical protein
MKSFVLQDTFWNHVFPYIPENLANKNHKTSEIHANTSNLVLVRRPFCVEVNRFQFEFHPEFILFYTEPTQTRIKYAWLFFIMGYRTPNVTILKSRLGNEIGRTVPGYSFISCTWHNSLCYACRSAENQRTQHIDLSAT